MTPGEGILVKRGGGKGLLDQSLSFPSTIHENFRSAWLRAGKKKLLAMRSLGGTHQARFEKDNPQPQEGVVFESGSSMHGGLGFPASVHSRGTSSQVPQKIGYLPYVPSLTCQTSVAGARCL